MTLALYVVVTALVATGLFLGIRYFARAYLSYRDSRIIICPGNRVATIVEVDAVHAALTSVLGQPDVRLQNCAPSRFIKVAGRNAWSSLMWRQKNVWFVGS